MKKLTKLLLCTMMLSLATSVYANNCGSCGSCSSSSSSCNSCCNSTRSCCDCECRGLSRTTFAARPQFQVCSPEYLTSFRDRMEAREDGRGGAFQVAVFGGRSTKKGKLATFFTPFCKTKLLVSDDPTLTPDIDPQHFNVVLTGSQVFTSEISFCPRMTVFGIGLNYKQNLHQLFQDDEDYKPEDEHLWFEISTPITRVETTMGLSERILTEGERAPLEVTGLDQTFFASMTEAFNQSAWCYGRINGCCECSKWRLADVTLMLGYEVTKGGRCFWEAYGGVVAPTGNERCARYVFEPIVGNGKHWGLVFGSHIRFKFWEDDDDENNYWETTFDVHSQYLFKKEQLRSFDLKCKPWSRYMEVYACKTQAEEADTLELTNEAAATLLSTPGINVFTKCVCVKPQFSRTLNTSLIYSRKKFRGEAGYNFYARESECLKLCCWKEGPALKANIGDGFTSAFRTIDKTFDSVPAECQAARELVNLAAPVTEYETTVIKKCDINLESATHHGFFSHTFYLALGARWDEREYPVFFDVGGSYEYGCENVVLNRWTAWVKGGLSF